MKANIFNVGLVAIVIACTTMAFDFPGKPAPKKSEYPMARVIRTIEPTEKLPVVDACSITNNAFEVGEEITYKIFYNWNFVWLPAGEVVFKTADHGDQYHIIAEGKTYSTYEWFFKVRDKYEVFIDKETLLPISAIRNVREGGYRLYDKLEFDHNNKKLTSLRGKTKETAVLRPFDVDACVHDILSIIYHARNIEFNSYNAGQEFPIKIFMDKKMWPLKVKYAGKEEKKKVKGRGRFNTIKFSPEVIVGDVFSEEAKMDVWVTDDRNKIPLIIESPVSVGSIKVILKDYKGLRYPMESKVK